ncbi:MAG: TonB-dependent receptor [Azonexus sp.]
MLQKKMPGRPGTARKYLAVAVLLTCQAGSVLAGPNVSVEIAQQELAPALRQLASQAGVQIVHAADAVGSMKVKAFRGEMSVEQALGRLLQGSGLEFRRDGDSYVIVAASRAEQSLNEVVVTATRTERRIDDVPASISVITTKDIASQRPTVISDLLRNIEGVDVSNTASLAGSESVMLRGIGGSYGGSTSQVLLDGMPLESPITGIHYGMKTLAVQDVERIEVVRGPASALYGPSAVGGVVNLMSKRWQGAPGAEVQIGGGSHGSTLVSGAVGGAWDVADFRLSVSDYRTDGYVAQPKPDRWGTRDLGARDGTDKKFALTGGLRPSENQEVTFGIRHSDIESAWLGGHPNYRIHARLESYDLGYRAEIGDWAVVKARYRKLQQKARAFFDADAYMANGDLSLAEFDNRTDSSDSIDLQADLRLARNNVLSLGYSYGQGKYTTTADYTGAFLGFPAEQTSSKSELTGLFIQDEHRFSEALSVLLGGRWDHYRFFGDSRDGVATGKNSSDNVFNPRVGVRYRLTEAASVYATAGTAYVPALNSLKFRSGGVWLDNVGLKPETSASYELGANYRYGPVTTCAAIYHTDYTDKIEVITVGAQRQFSNVSKVAVNGLEFAMEGSFSGGWHPYVNYTYTDSKIEENPGDLLTEGKRLQRVSPHKLNLGVTYAPSDSWYGRISGRHVAAYYFNDQNTADARNPAHFVADAKIGVNLPTGGFARKLELSLAINNLFDKRYGEQQYEYLDGRNIWLGLNARF